ncbi:MULTISPECIES: SIS domain-containing protein [Enterococcus]|jgi:fructoselysine-6-phosphate deglycase|uniref:Fructosamine deglycase n=1 Tax=Enterococcus dispar ATCC 51266 TaxID=1139219 RepID=S1NC07_9ENTE|nr:MULTISPECIES: SIS domain-containing protein [Enterococcus]EOT40097.1 phosphosugar isomerase [Enterococcus dispar ATCC 51266]EOW86620.1 phosphosugar isomerase [Enterococcus dispar ATCC 51266]MCU7357533.1 SIS domain-containing protein [Enterococcus dispar]MDT2705872.1 SIS domain-containing protein [Enterococcus dispar]OJG39414.1 phosphosugar isomerase [Enterococcus dispar]
MLKFNEQKQIDDIQGALDLRPEVEKIIDSVWEKGFDNIYYLGIGGTYASAMQAVTYINGKSNLPAYVQHAAEYYTTGNKRLTKDSIVVLSSVTGTTQEVVKAVDEIKTVGATLIGFIDTEHSPLAEKCDYVITYPAPGTEQIKFFMVADRLMKNNGEFDDYEDYYQELEGHLAKGLVEAEKQADAFGLEFAEKHRHDAMHYFIGAGNQWGAVYSYAMCYWEEQSWLRSKSIHAAEFLHGTLEIVDETTPVTLFLGEDEQRPLAERVKNLLPRICGNYTFIDSKDYAVEGISEKYRGRVLSFLLMHCVTQRIDAHVEKLNCHPLEIRRYYRQFDY